ncbi:MAG: PASTA domain-containing protein [Myxococcota bacterium]|nr:PASTA domain-containing protein [Myxococcota bacterium]
MCRQRVVVLAALCVWLLAPTCGAPGQGDVDGSGVVDMADLALVQGCFGSRPPVGPACRPSDANGDGRVDILDVSIVASLLAPSRVPRVSGQTVAEAEVSLVRSGLTAGGVTQANNALVPPGAVIRTTPSSGTPLPFGTPVDLLVSGPVLPEPNMLSAAWEGTWDVRTVSIEPSSGSVVTTSEAKVELCSGDPLGLALLPSGVVCSASSDDVLLAFRCTAQASQGPCTVDLVADYRLEQTVPGVLEGHGGFDRGISPGCLGVVDPRSEEIEVHAVRRGPQTTSCGGIVAAVSQKVIRPLLPGLRP